MQSNTFCAHCGRGASNAAQDNILPVNELLSHQPVPALQNGLAREMEQDIEAVEAEISRAQAVVERLVAKRDTLSQRWKRSQNAVSSSLRHLPNEIIAEIFMNYLPPFPSAISRSNGPLLLGQICQTWREIALATPRLWSSIVIYFGIRPTAWIYEAHLAKTWRERSGGCSLSIALMFNCRKYNLPKGMVDEVHPALPIMFGCSDRWVDVRLKLPDVWIQAFAAVKGRLPLLENLAFSPASGTHYEDSEEIDAFEHAPLLRTFNLQMIDLNYFILPWHNLTKLVAEDQTVNISLDIMSECQNLVECEIYGLRLDEEDSDPLEIQEFELADLQSLHLDIDACSSELFESMTLPSLRDIRLDLRGEFPSLYGGAWDSRPAFVTMLSRSQCALQSLTLKLGYMSMDEADLVACLSVAPVLTQLTIEDARGSALTDAVLHQITPRGPMHDCLIPKLGVLKIGYKLQDFSDHLFAEMVRSRWELVAVGSPLAKLHTVEITFLGADPAAMRKTLDILRKFKGQGMKVSAQGPRGRHLNLPGVNMSLYEDVRGE